MPSDSAATQIARTLMVDGQVRPNKVTDARIIAAMRKIARERFVPAHLQALAYTDEDVPLGGGRFLMEPMVIARLVQIAMPRPDDRALVVAAGSGYGAALLAACGAQVTALEQDPTLLALARAALPVEAPSVVLVEGKPVEGWSRNAPYDIILIEGAVEDIPAAVAAQLRPVVGRLVTVRVAPGQSTGARIGQAVLGEASAAGISFLPVFDCAVPLLPMMRRAEGFVF